MILPDYIAAHLNTPFEWGKFDCILFVHGWVEHSTGINYLQGVTPWHSGMQAMRTLGQLGGLVRVLDARFERISSRIACDGDIGIYQKAAHLFSGAHVVGPARDGLTFTDRMMAEEFAWSLHGAKVADSSFKSRI
ncbi:DUF6950 family protein [Lacisediminimonas profundi]|uniref:DUF6950 family protein n=1 Tax=Lacisediminimonas profundi TaxID=2603856 RepID=UPI00124B4070|nr:hypothetical protein [Lacisediminimonas profundi]